MLFTDAGFLTRKQNTGEQILQMPSSLCLISKLHDSVLSYRYRQERAWDSHRVNSMKTKQFDIV